MDKDTFLRCFLIFLMLSRNCVFLNKPCARFQFPTLTGSQVTVGENTTLTLPFAIQSHNCNLPETFYLKVSKLDASLVTQCLLSHREGKCVPPYRVSKCTCPSDDSGVYVFTDFIDRSDNTTWVWSTSEEWMAKANITFNVLYAGRVTSLDLITPDEHQLPMHPGTPVDVVCSYDPGNPPVTARLLDRHGVEMEGSIYSSGQIRYTFPAVGCQDAGLIRCQAPGASHNMTATLLVRCPPELRYSTTNDFTATMNTDLEVEFHLRSYTRNLTKCTLKSETVSEIPVTMIVNCLRLIEVRGTPPDLLLTIRVENVKEQNEGSWRLSVSNRVGTGRIDFRLKVDQDVQVKSTQIINVLPDASTAASNTKQASLVLMYVTTIIAVVIVVGIISLSVTIICVKKVTASRANSLPPDRPGFQLDERPDNRVSRLARLNSGSSESVHTYEEVGRERRFHRLLSLARALRPSRRCQAPIADPDDYLHPVPTMSDVDEAPSDVYPAISEPDDEENTNMTDA